MKTYIATFNSNNGIETESFSASNAKEAKDLAMMYKRRNNIKGITTVKVKK